MATASAATVTIDRHYFETLLRRASLAGSNDAATDSQVSPSELLVLRNTARKYENLKRNLIRGGVEDPTIDLLSRDDSDIQANQAPPDDSSRVTPTTYRSPHVGQPRPMVPVDNAPTSSRPYTGREASYNLNPGGYRNTEQGAWADEEPELGDGDYEGTIKTEGPVGANLVPRQPSRNGQYDIRCTRTVLLSDLPEGTTHADVTDAVRGGLLLDIFLRPHDRCVAVSFLHAADARAFFNHVRKNDLYIRNKRVAVKWNDRQFTLAGHAVGKIGGGATRNMVIRGLNPVRHTEESIREDLEHIHNLVVIKVEFVGCDCYIKTNSVNYALFARTCMMSRGKYRGTKIEWDVDECAQPYEVMPQTKLQVSPRREAPPMRKGSSNLSNRFHLLHLEDGSEDEVADTFQAQNSVGILA